jgi:hypothetical protein
VDRRPFSQTGGHCCCATSPPSLKRAPHGPVKQQLAHGWGDRQYKRAVRNHTRQDGPKYLYASSPTGLRLNFLFSMTQLVDAGFRMLVVKSSVLEQMNKSWQNRRRKATVEPYFSTVVLMKARSRAVSKIWNCNMTHHLELTLGAQAHGGRCPPALTVHR